LEVAPELPKDAANGDLIGLAVLPRGQDQGPVMGVNVGVPCPVDVGLSERPAGPVVRERELHEGVHVRQGNFWRGCTAGHRTF